MCGWVQKQIHFSFHSLGKKKGGGWGGGKVDGGNGLNAIDFSTPLYDRG